MCLEYKCFYTGDWAWFAEIWNQVVPASGIYCLVGLVRFVDGIPEMVPMLFKHLVAAFLALKLLPDEIPSLQQCKSTKLNAYALTNSETFEYFGDLITQAKNDYIDQHGPFRSKKEEHDWELETSKKQKHGVLRKTEFPVKVWIFDVFHSFVAINVTTFCLFITICWCVWEWKPRALKACVAKLQMHYIDKHIDKYIKSNKTRNHSKWFVIKMNGEMTRDLVKGYPYFYAACSIIANKMEEKKNNNNLIQSLLISVFFRVSSLLHCAFGTLWRVQFKVENDEIPSELIEMKENIRRATWLAIKLCTCMVCKNPNIRYQQYLILVLKTQISDTNNIN